MSSVETMMDFKNEALTDFSQPAERAAMEKALADVRRQLGQIYPLMIGGKALKSKKTIRSINPSRFSEVVGIVQDADRAQADRALDAAVRAFETWSRIPQNERAQSLRRMAQSLRRRKKEFCAWMIFEVGKSWAEADADVAEAIDFLDYYAEQSMQPVSGLTPVSLEKNDYAYLPLGPVVVIPPWNFPLAILVGMTTAAVVTGNTVVLKPSSQSPIIAAKFMEVVAEAEVPPGVVNFLTGAGRSIGDLLVSDARTRMVAFTGSKSVGLHINELTGRPAKRQKWIKRVIAEMGGKNAIIVDESASIEDAAQGVMVSAFGYQGQKCSACSRAYIHESVYEPFVDRLLKKVQQIRVGPADLLDHFMGPVISADAYHSILNYIACGRKHGRLLAGQAAGTDRTGYFIQPTVIDRLARTCKVWSEEIFGPVLALGKIKSFEDGLREANSTDYGLTGAIYSQDPAHWEQARREFFCGNLYINRKCTGAMVGGHPFGGFNLSGTDSKAGGPDYLALFRQAKVVSQKL